MDIKNHRLFRMDPLDMDIAPGVLKQAHLIDDYFISGGTLLGLYRDGDFIAGDSDIDIDVIGYEGVDDYLFKTLGHMDLIRTGYFKGRPMQTAFQDKGTIFDVWMMWREGDHMINQNDMGLFMMPAKFYDNPVEIETKYGSYRAPGPVDEYLAFRYGRHWKIPTNSKGIYTGAV